jgi:hypothetical protein
LLPFYRTWDEYNLSETYKQIVPMTQSAQQGTQIMDLLREFIWAVLAAWIVEVVKWYQRKTKA